MCEVWFEFYSRMHEGIRPRFTSADGAKLRDILVALEDHAATTGDQWTVKFGTGIFRQFLVTAWSDSWLRTKFTLRNIELQYNVIFAAMLNPQRQSKPAGKVPAIHNNTDVLKSVLADIYTPNANQQ